MRLTLLALAGAMIACGGHGDDDGNYTGLELDPAYASVTVQLGATATQDYKVYGVTASGAKTDITQTCALSIDPLFGGFTGATATIQPHGGRTNVNAMCGTLTATGSLDVNLVGNVITPGTPGGAPGTFGSATTGTDALRTPVIEYPIDKAVAPRNMPPVETQWTMAGNDLFHVKLTSQFVSVDVYTIQPESMLGEADWDSIMQSSAGDSLAIAVEGLSQGAPGTKYASTPVVITVARDVIDKTAIYWWASSKGSILEQTFGAPPPAGLVKDGCTSCHSVSRTGSRIGYSRCVANDCGQLYAGFLKYSNATMSWQEAVNADGKTIHGSYSTFSPVGNPFPSDQMSLAIVSMAGGTLALYDPDTGAPVASNLGTVSTHGAGAPRSGLMADWSPDGNKVVYASSPGTGQWIDLSAGAIAILDYAYTGGVHTFSEPQFIISNPITLPNGTYNNFFFPSFSPDGKYIVFNAARTGWRNGADAKASGSRLMLTDPSGTYGADLTALNGGNADLDITWPHWAPTVGEEYYWIVFSSERDYGHRLTAANSNPACNNVGVTQCKQIWIGAVAKSKLGAAGDPSAPPMWLPSQDVTADNISPYWSVPSGVQ